MAKISKDAADAISAFNAEMLEVFKQRPASEPPRSGRVLKCPNCKAIGTFGLWKISGLSYFECERCKYHVDC